VIARLGGNGSVEVRRVTEHAVDGRVVRSETKLVAIGQLDDSGVFTSAKDGPRISLDNKGKLVGFPPNFGEVEVEVEVEVTAAPEQRKAAMLIILAMLSAGSSGTSAPATPAKK